MRGIKATGVLAALCLLTGRTEIKPPRTAS